MSLDRPDQNAEALAAVDCLRFRCLPGSHSCVSDELALLKPSRVCGSFPNHSPESDFPHAADKMTADFDDYEQPSVTHN